MGKLPVGARFWSWCGAALCTAVFLLIKPTHVGAQAARRAEWSEIHEGRKVQFVRDTLGDLLALRGTVLRKDATALEVFSRQGQDTTTWRIPITSLRTMEVRDWRYHWKFAAIGAVFGTLAGPLLVFNACLDSVKCPQGGNWVLVVTGATAIIGFAVGGQRRRWIPVRIPTSPPPG